MRRSPHRALALAILLAPILLAGRARAQAHIGFNPDPALLFKKGQIATISVVIQSATPVQAFDLDVQFDPTLLHAVAVNGNPAFDGNDALTYLPIVDNASGTIHGIVDARLGAPGPSGTFLVANLVFRLLRTGGGSMSVMALSQQKGLADALGSAIAGEPETITVTVATAVDSDLDGLSNSYEQMVTGTDPAKRDTDMDGILDGLEDSDQDGLTNIKEYNRGTNALAFDSDMDGTGDAADNCPSTPNVSQADGDGDGLGDVCDPDRDQDQIDDIDEPALGLEPWNPDTDGDGALDGIEVIAGTDPLDPESTPTSIPTLDDGGALALALLLIAGAARRIRR